MIVKVIRQFFLLFRYLLGVNWFYFHKFPYLNKYKGGKAYVLVNGPSLKKALDDYDKGINKFDENCFMVNLSPLDPRFFKIKPKHFLLSDPIFYQDFEAKKDQVRRMYTLLEEKVERSKDTNELHPINVLSIATIFSVSNPLKSIDFNLAHP